MRAAATGFVDFKLTRSTRLEAWRVGSARGKQERQMQMVMNSLERARRFGKKLGPYVVMEILLPGGTLLALLLVLHQRGRLNIWVG
jgi:hypothetical protein